MEERARGQGAKTKPDLTGNHMTVIGCCFFISPPGFFANEPTSLAPVEFIAPKQQTRSLSHDSAAGHQTASRDTVTHGVGGS